MFLSAGERPALHVLRLTVINLTLNVVELVDVKVKETSVCASYFQRGIRLLQPQDVTLCEDR